MAQMGPTPCQFNKLNCQVFTDIKKYKKVFKIQNNNLRKIFILMAL